jgi:hypothetical protein
MCALAYNAPKRDGVVTRYVRPYEVSVRLCLWGTDSLHGPRTILAFLLSRIVTGERSGDDDVQPREEHHQPIGELR